MGKKEREMRAWKKRWLESDIEELQEQITAKEKALEALRSEDQPAPFGPGTVTVSDMLKEFNQPELRKVKDVSSLLIEHMQHAVGTLRQIHFFLGEYDRGHPYLGRIELMERTLKRMISDSKGHENNG